MFRSCMSLFFTCISLLINWSQLIKTAFLRNLDQISYIMVYYPIECNRISDLTIGTATTFKVKYSVGSYTMVGEGRESVRE